MRLYLRLAWRNIWRQSRRTLIVVVAMGLGLALMMFYDGFVAGFEQAIYGNAIRILGGNIQVHAVGYGESNDENPLLPLAGAQAVVDAAVRQPQVVAASLRINTAGMAANREGAFPLAITGIEPELEAPVSLIAQNVVAGRYLKTGDGDQVLIGKGLADAMGVELGDRVTLAGKAAHEQMRQRTVTIIGIYDVGLPDIEKRTIYMSLGEAQTLYGLRDSATEVMISLTKIGQERAVATALRATLPGYEIDSWESNFPELQAALGSKGAVMNVFSVIILMIAGIGILNLLLMAVYERTREIGLLGAMGLKPRQISTLFILEGTMMGIVGVAFGVILGLSSMALLGRVGFDYSAFSSITSYTALITGRVYPTLGVEKLPVRALTVAVIAALAATIPAREAALREPAEALHYV